MTDVSKLNIGDTVIIMVDHDSFIKRPVGIINRLSHRSGDFVVEVQTIYGEDYYSFRYCNLRIPNKFFRKLYEI